MAGPGPHHPRDDDSDLLQRAVEQFIAERQKNASLEPSAFAQDYPEALRKKISARCRHFLLFDDFVGSIVEDDGAAAQPAGRTFGEFVIEDELGRGGMGIVYLAYQPSLRRRVALKTLASGLALSPRHVERFRREAAAAATLRHPAIVPVHTFCEVDGSYAFAMDFVAGRNLGSILDDLRQRNGRNPLAIEGSFGLSRAPSIAQGYVAECARLCADIASALAAAHAAGLAHRDVKPRNLMIDDRGAVRLLDFGLAKNLEQDGLTNSLDITGSVHYMSPEQTLQKKVAQDFRTDVFSLGVILYELLTLRRPFDGENLQQIVYEICFRDPTPIHDHNPRVPKDLVTICEKAIEKTPEARYQSAAELEDDLRRFLRLEPIRATPSTIGQRASKWIRRNRAASITALALATASLLGAAYVAIENAADRRQAQELWAVADEAKATGDHARAIECATDALALVPDDAEARSRLQLLRKESELFATEAMRKKAEANVKLLESRQLAGSQRERAIVLALQGVALHDTPQTRGAVLDALRRGYRITSFDEGRASGRIRANGDGTIVSTDSIEGPTRLWDAKTGSMLFELAGNGFGYTSQFLPDGDRIATGDRSGATLWNARTGKMLRRFDTGATVHEIAFDATGSRMLTADNVAEGGVERSVAVWDLTTGQRLGSSRGARWSMANALTADGTIAVTTHDRGFAIAWDATTGAELARMPIDGIVIAMALQPARTSDAAQRSQLVALATDEGMVRVYSMPTSQKKDATLVAQAKLRNAVRAVQFSPDGALLATCGADRTARLWLAPGAAPQGPRGIAVEASFSADAKSNTQSDVATLEEVCVLSGHESLVTSVRFDASGDTVATACYDGKLRLFDARTGERTIVYETGGPMHDAWIGVDSARVYFESSGRRTQSLDFDEPTGVLELAYGEAARAAVFATDRGMGGCFTAGGDYGQQLCEWNADGTLKRLLPKIVASPSSDNDRIVALAFPNSKERIAVGFDSGAVALVDPKSGSVLLAMKACADEAELMQFSHDGKKLLVSSRATPMARVFDADSGATLREFPLPANARDVALSPDGALVATACDNDSVLRIWSVSDGTLVRAMQGHSKTIQCARFASDSQSVWTCGDDGEVRHSRLDGALLLSCSVGEPLRRCAVSDDGTIVVASNSSSRAAAAFVIDGKSGAIRVRQSLHANQIRWLEVSADGTRAITCGVDPIARAWPTDPVGAAIDALPESARKSLPASLR